MKKLILMAAVNSALVGGVGYGQYKLFDIDGARTWANTRIASNVAGLGTGTGRRGVGSRSRSRSHK